MPGTSRSDRRGLLGVYARRVRSQPLGATIRKLVEPDTIRRHLGRLVSGQISDASNPYLESHSREAEIEFCVDLLSVERHVVDRLMAEIEGDPYLADLQREYARVRPAATLELGRFRMWYAIARLTKPRIVLETGVHDGLSSSIILRALEVNGRGQLVSIDLPSTDLPGRAGRPGWLVPEAACVRWELHLGDARALLRGVAAGAGPIDLFIHDSDHSAEHQVFEYGAVASHLAPSAIILSDQDYPHETALSDFATAHCATHRRVRTVSGDPGGFAGGVRFPGTASG